MPIIGEWKRNLTDGRCDTKHPFPFVKMAQKAARLASQRTGHLIIAYECIDCGLYHIGHADRSQIIVRQERPLKEPGPPKTIVLPTSCPQCGGPIPEQRRTAAERTGSSTVYCSRKCQGKGSRKARHARRAEVRKEWLRRIK